MSLVHMYVFLLTKYIDYKKFTGKQNYTVFHCDITFTAYQIHTIKYLDFANLQTKQKYKKWIKFVLVIIMKYHLWSGL